MREMSNGGSSSNHVISRSGTGISEENYEKKLTPFEKLSLDLTNDQRVLKEITLGKRIGFYRIRGELGSGNFSQVKMGIHALTREKVAIKILDKTKLDQKTQRLLSREISSMEKLHHPNIIRLYEVVETLAKLHIVMEYAGGGELFTKISNEGKFPEPEARNIFAQVISAVDHMILLSQQRRYIEMASYISQILLSQQRRYIEMASYISQILLSQQRRYMYIEMASYISQILLSQKTILQLERDILLYITNLLSQNMDDF